MPEALSLPFTDETGTAAPRWITEGVLLLPGFAETASLYPFIERIAKAAPFRHMMTPGGHAMSASMTNCGALGWVSDRQGYRYAPADPLTGMPWPEMPATLRKIAIEAAALAGFMDFDPDACLINCYEPGARMGLHQDKDEADFSQPVITLSVGLPAILQLAGVRRTGPSRDILLEDGDVLVLGGPARLYYHGIRPVRDGMHPVTGRCRISLTLRQAEEAHAIR